MIKKKPHKLHKDIFFKELCTRHTFRIVEAVSRITVIVIHDIGRILLGSIKQKKKKQKKRIAKRQKPILSKDEYI